MSSYSTSETYRLTMQKLNDIAVELDGCIAVSDFIRAKRCAEQLTTYENCFYCISFRLNLSPTQIAGVCDRCPLHKYGESLAGRRIPQNGCYRSPEYRQMVRAASWLFLEPSIESIRDLIIKIKKTVTKLAEIKTLVCENVT